MNSLHPDALTLYECVRRGARVSNNGPMLGKRVKQADGSEPYVWLNYIDIIDRSVTVAHAMRHIGIPSGQSSFVGIYAKNRPEWIITEHACYTFSNILVPLYETLGAEACVFSLNQTEIQIVFCDTLSKAKSLMEQKEQCTFLKFLVVMDERITEEDKAAFTEVGLTLYGFSEFEALGATAEKTPIVPPKPDDLATICYTSGTTGTPKGVMLTHGNVMADGTTLDSFYPEFNTDGVFMSFFPLAEMFERVVQSVMFTQGGRVGFSRGDIRGLVDDIKTLQPTVLPVVPSVLNEIYDEAMSCFSFKTALSFKWRKFWPSIFRNDSFVDNLVFKKIRDQLGGKVKLMITGSAPLAEKVVLFVYGTFGCFVLNRYGKSECIAATVFFEGVSVPGHVGVPSPCNIIKLVDVPELGYFARDNGGEVCIKGTNVFETYYKNEEQTKEVLDNDGWLHTGDIGRWTEDGTLKIVDCKKHIFKLAKGEYAPERIENIYLSSKFVAQSFVYGESLKTCLIAIIVPDHEVLPVEASKTLGIAKLSMEELCQREDVKKMIMDDLFAVGKTAGLYSFEQVKDIFVSSEMFSVENDLFTPTLKSKRPKLKEHFKAQITSMYEKLD